MSNIDLTPDCIGGGWEPCVNTVPPPQSTSTTGQFILSSSSTSSISSTPTSTQSLPSTTSQPTITPTHTPSTVIVTATILPTSSNLPAVSSPQTHTSNDLRVVGITIGCVGGIAVLILLIYWAANFLASRRPRYHEDPNLESGMTTPMISGPYTPSRTAPPPPRPALSRPRRISMLPARKAVTFERQPRSSKTFSDIIAHVHPGTKVFFGSPAAKASKIVPTRKPVPSRVKSYPGSGTESVYSDDQDDVSTVLGGTNKSVQEPFRPLPTGVALARWLKEGRVDA